MEGKTIKHHKTYSNKQIGSWGEQLATTWLQNNGYTILDKNVYVRYGELDIVAWHHKQNFGRTLCFIEVKTRSAYEGSAEAAVGKKKQHVLMRSAMMYCTQKHIAIHHTPIQFEQISIYRNSGTNKHTLRHYILPLPSY